MEPFRLRRGRNGHERHRQQEPDTVIDAADHDVVDDTFQGLYRSEYASVVRLARLLTGQPSGAEDIAQEAFVRLYRSIDRADRPEALLRTITVNVARNWHRTRSRAQRQMVRHGPEPESLTEFERELDHSLRRLPHDQRAVVVLRYWVGLSEAEIADALGCRPGTVKSRHSRAITTLRKDLS